MPPLTRRLPTPRHVSAQHPLRAAAAPAVLVLALTAAFAGLVTTTASATPPVDAVDSAQVALMASSRTDDLRASRSGSGRTPPGAPATASASAPAAAPTPAPAPPAPAPVAARPSDGAVTSGYGQRWGRLHAGLDFATGTGSPVRSAAAGTVASAGAESGYGNTVRVTHPDGAETVYAHLSSIEVAPGQAVTVGEQLGREGNTGRSTGPHLHFEVRYADAPVDPAAWLLERGVTP